MEEDRELDSYDPLQVGSFDGDDPKLDPWILAMIVSAFIAAILVICTKANIEENLFDLLSLSSFIASMTTAVIGLIIFLKLKPPASPNNTQDTP